VHALLDDGVVEVFEVAHGQKGKRIKEKVKRKKRSTRRTAP
jgi:hypothetical protein